MGKTACWELGCVSPCCRGKAKCQSKPAVNQILGCSGFSPRIDTSDFETWKVLILVMIEGRSDRRKSEISSGQLLLKVSTSTGFTNRLILINWFILELVVL